MQFVGNNNSKGASGGSTSNSLTITKTYTIGYADVQPLMVGGVNDGIDEHCYVNLSQPQTSILQNNSNSTYNPTTSTSITTSLKNNVSNGGYYIASKSINIVGGSTNGIVLTKFIDNENNVKYGYQGTYTASPTQISYSLTVSVYCKPCYQDPSTSTNMRVRGNLKLLVWNTQINDYETIEGTNLASSASSSNNKYIYSGSIAINLAHYYILCGILEANSHYEDYQGDTSKVRWLTDEDFE